MYTYYPGDLANREPRAATYQANDSPSSDNPIWKNEPFRVRQAACSDSAIWTQVSVHHSNSITI